MPARTPSPELFWFIPGTGDGRHPGAATRLNAFGYLASVAQAADTPGFDGVLLATGGLSEDTIVIGSALLSLSQRLRFPVAVWPGLISPILAARINASLDRISNGRANLTVVSGSGKFDFEGLPLSHEERYELTREWLAAFRGAFGNDAVNLKGKHIHIENGNALLASVQRPDQVAEKFADVRRQAEARGRDSLRIGKNLWAGVGLVRGGAGTALVGSPENTARTLAEYRDVGVGTFILSGYPHLEEAYGTAELLFPAIGKESPIFQAVQKAIETATLRAGSATVGRFSSI